MKNPKKTILPFKLYISWPIKIFILAVSLSLIFSTISEMLLVKFSIVISCLIIVILVIVAVVSDMIGVAVTVASFEVFKAMATKNVIGAKETLIIINNAEKVSSLCNDVIGDVCGILSGAGGASIVLKITSNLSGHLQVCVASVISAIIAGLTIYGKAVAKKYSISNCNKIVLSVGKCIFKIKKLLRLEKSSRL